VWDCVRWAIGIRSRKSGMDVQYVRERCVQIYHILQVPFEEPRYYTTTDSCQTCKYYILIPYCSIPPSPFCLSENPNATNAEESYKTCTKK
jgi:hypothetical protein